VLKGIIELRKNGLFGYALIKKTEVLAGWRTGGRDATIL